MPDRDGEGPLICLRGGEGVSFVSDSSLVSLVFMRAGQKLDVVMDRSRLGRAGSDFADSFTGAAWRSSTGSSTKGFLKSHMELEWVIGGR